MAYAVLLGGLSLFYGFAFEEFYGKLDPNRRAVYARFHCSHSREPHFISLSPAINLFLPLVSLSSEPGFLHICARLWSLRASVSIRTSFCPTAILLAYVLGAVVFTQPLWFAVALVVGCVLLIAAREPLHALVRHVPS